MAWNLPNLITIVRIAIIPVFLFFLLSGLVPRGEVIALIIFAVAALSDAVDGWLARNRSQVTDFGKFADPVADKLLVMAALLAFVGLGEIWTVWVVIILAREFLVMGLRILAIAHDVVIPASLLGKLKTLSHIGLVLVLLGNRYWEWGPVGEDVKLAFIYLAVVLALASGFEYFYKSRGLLRRAAS
jgi:CDP-diacylglycerol--glycerol-3-phosphate 3-phosphatidyltransferase